METSPKPIFAILPFASRHHSSQAPTVMKMDYMDRLSALAARLPFHVEDVDEVNALFLRWHKEQRHSDLKTLELWVYCRTQMYVLRKLARDTEATPNDFDQLSSVVFTKVQRGMTTVREPDRFSNWVNVVCRNAYVNERKKERPRDELNEDLLMDGPGPTLLDVDRAEVLRVVTRAIDRLPPSLSAVARMKLLEKKSYKQIAEVTGLPISSTRTYAAKVLNRLRKDLEVQEIVRDIIPGLSIRSDVDG